MAALTAEVVRHLQITQVTVVVKKVVVFSSAALNAEMMFFSSGLTVEVCG